MISLAKASSPCSASFELALVDKACWFVFCVAHWMSLAFLLMVRRNDCCLERWPTGGDCDEECLKENAVPGRRGDAEISTWEGLGKNEASRNTSRRPMPLSLHSNTVRDTIGSTSCLDRCCIR